ncbi:hypothetical protein WJX79_002808 [Trebouxia sp. C0005]
MEAVLAEKAYEALQAERQSTEFRIKALGKALEYKHLEAAHGSHVEFLKIPITLPQAQAAAPGTESDVHQLKMELAGYQSCCKRLGDDLAVKDQELEDWRRQTEDQKKRTEQVILDTSAREAELLLRNRELTQELEKQRQEAGELTCTALTKEESLGKLQVEVHRLSSSVSALRNNDPDPEQQLASMRTDMAEKDQKINSLEKYIAGIMKDGITNNVVLKELHEALAAKDSSIAELQRLDSSSSEASSDDGEVRPDEADVQQSWWSAKADSLTAEVVRLQTEAAEAEERHSGALQGAHDTIETLQTQVLDLEIKYESSLAEAEEEHKAAMQGADDHINRLQAQVQSLQANSAQAELNRVKAELGESENAVSHLRQQLEAQQAEVLRLKESQGGSNKAADVIHALEKQVHELRANLTAAAAATARAQQQADTAHADMAKLQTQLHSRTNSPAVEAELQELRSQLSARQGPGSSRRGSGGSPLNPRLSMSGMQANDTINMLEAEVNELQAELAATQAVAAKHQRTAAASGQEIKVLQRLSSSGDISFMRTHSQTGRRSTTGHRHSEQGIPSFGSHDDLIHLQARCEASEAEVQHLQQRLHAASSDRTAELEHVQQLNRSLKAEIAAMQNNLAGMSGTFTRPDSQTQPEEMNSHGGALESFGSCLLIDPGSSLGQSLPQLGGGNDASDNNMLQPYRAAHRLASIPEGDGNVSTHTSMQGDEGMQDVHLVPELQSQVRSLAVSLQDKTQEAEALHQIVDQFKSEASGSGSPSSSSERPLRLRLLMKSFSTGSRGYERMHNVKNNVKQLLMPWKRKLAEFDGEEVQNNDDFGTHPVLQTLQGIARTKPGQQTVTELDMAWHHDQLEDAHEMCDKLEQQNDFLRAELAKHGVIVEGDEERSFALGCVPDQPRHSSSFSDSVPGSARGADGKGGASEMGDSISGVRPALLNIARESDAACHELQQMMDRLQGQLSATTSTAPPNISPFAKVAAGSKEEQLQATKSLCSEAVLQAVEVRSHLAALVEVLQPREAAAEEGNVEPITEEPNKASPPPTAAWRQSFDVSGSSNFGDPANRDSLDSSVGTRPSFDLQPKTKQTVSFQMLDQPVYSANLDSFVSGNRKLEHDLSSFDSDFDTSQLDNPLFGSTMGREHVHGTRGVALTRASVAAQMFQNMAQADSSLNVESRQQLAQGVRVVKHQVTDKSKQLDAASAQLAQTLAQMHALVVSTSALTDQLTSTQQQFRAEQATSHRLSQQLDSSQSECMRLKAQAQDSRQGLQDAVDKTKHWRRSTEEHQALLEQSAGHSSQLQADLEHVIEVTGVSHQESEAMSEGELKKMAEAFRKSLGLESSSSTVRLPRTKSALFKVTSNKAQESQLFSEIGLLEADLTSTRKDLYAANVRTKSLTSVLKDRTGKMQALEDRVASHDELFKAANQKAARLQNSLQVLQSKLQERDDQVSAFEIQTQQLHTILNKRANDSRAAGQATNEVVAQLAQRESQLEVAEQQRVRMEEDMRDRDAAMQQLLRGADRIEDVQRDTFRQLADAQSECASKEVQLTSSAQEISQLRAQLSMVESKLAAHDSRPGTPDSSSPAAHMAELVSLRAELQQKELEVSELHLQLQAALSTSAEGLSRGVSGQSPDSEQVEQLQSELQQRGGQVQKLKADLEYSQDELQDLQRHCRSLEVEVNKLRDALVSCEPSKDKAASPVRTPAGRGRPAPTASASSSAKGSAGATVALRLLKERADSAEARAAAALRQVAELKASLQELYNSSQMQTKEMQVKLDSQKRKRQQLEEEVSASQAHVAELTAILKSAVRSNSGSGPTGSQSPRSSPLSREVSGGEVGPRLRSKELQALTQRLQMSVADARSDLERHSSLKSADLRAEFSGSSRKPGQIPLSPDRAPTSPRGRPQAQTKLLWI